MPRSFAATLSALAMALVAMRGAIGGEPVASVTAEAIVAMFVFAGIGYVAGWIADYLVRESLERKFRERIDWYQNGLEELGLETAKDTAESGTGKQKTA